MFLANENQVTVEMLVGSASVNIFKWFVQGLGLSTIRCAISLRLIAHLFYSVISVPSLLNNQPLCMQFFVV
jgi:hypothetical protein